MTKLQQRIKEYSQQKLANDAAVNKGTVSLVMSGKSSFGKHSGLRVARVLNLSLEVALGLTDE